MKTCDYGCGNKATYQFKNDKWCCSKNHRSCPAIRLNISKKLSNCTAWNKGKTGIFSVDALKQMSESHMGEKNYWYGKKLTKSHRRNISNSNLGKIITKETRDKLRRIKKENKYAKGIKYEKNIYNSRRNSIETINKKYNLFSKIEEMRYNPDKPNEKEIQVRCKNHNCKNSKEQGGWFTPTYNQLYERIRQVEKDYGNGGCYFYCSNKCKDECPLYNIRTYLLDHEETEKTYTESEYQTFRKYVLERDNYKCQYCDEKAEHVHHERPQKLEPFFALDPDYAWSCCEKCHYEKGHRDICNTHNLAKKSCEGEK